MGRRGLRFMAIACCLPLVLPAGWCCWLLEIEPKAATFATAGTAAPVKTAGLCCRTHDSRPHNGEQKHQERRTPPFQHCPCSDRQATPPSFSTVEYDAGGNLGLAVPLLSDNAPPVIGGVVSVVLVARPPVCPLHVRNCVWRC